MEKLLENQEVPVSDRKVIIGIYGVQSVKKLGGIVTQLRGTEGKANVIDHKGLISNIEKDYP